jgi:membrane-associated phospholipid phosphatase
MGKQTQVRQRVANLTSNILNPFLISLTLILLLSFTSTSSAIDAIKWALISAALSVLPVFLVILYLVRNGKLDTIFTNVRQQRTRIYLIAGLFAIAGLIILSYLKAPSILVTGFIAGILGVLIFTLINLWWKISLHTAFVAASTTILVMLYGWPAVAAVALVPLIAWARVELEYHSLAQVAGGAVLAALIVFAVFYPTVIINHV